MYNVEIKLTVQIEGCPESGLAAVDFRRAAGLPEAPTNQIELKVVNNHEVLCRRYQKYLTADADLVLVQDTDRMPNYRTAEAAKQLVAKAVRDNYPQPHCKYKGLPVVSAKVVANFIGWLPTVQPTEGVIPLVDSLISFADSNEAAVQAAVAEAKAEKAAQDAAKAEAEDQRKAEAEVKKAATEQRRLKAESELREWATTNGSELLRLRITEGFEWVPLALTEWYAQLLGSETEASDPEGYSAYGSEDRKQPTLAEIQRLQQVRAKFPTATCSLVRVKYTPDAEGDGYDDDDDDEQAPIYHTEVKVEHLCCGHWERNFFLPV